MNDTIDADLLLALERPGTADVLRRAVALHEQHVGDEHWIGFEWHEVRCHPSKLNRLVNDGALRITYRSHSTTTWGLCDVEATRAALARVGTDDRVLPASITEEIPADLFDIIEGQTRIKDLLRLAVSADRPVHMLLDGPAATAKSLFLGELARLQPSRYLLGGTTSKAGLVDFLLEERPRFLIIDELDKMPLDDMGALLSVMESGVVSRLKRRADQVTRMWVWVFAGVNRTARIKPELLSRFWHIRVHPYSDEQFIAVAYAILTKREGVDPELANYIARQVLPKSRDPRDAVKIARLGKSMADIDLLIAELEA